jgi:hypothetical protein
MTIINKYQNGNCAVTLHDDGTKIREYQGVPHPLFPESIDFKITNKCNIGCDFCHEESIKEGDHADFLWIINTLQGLPKGVEIAIGGGNPFEHPYLDDLLDWLKSVGLVANITINAKHLDENTVPKIKEYRANSLIHGLGISYTSSLLIAEQIFENVIDKNTIIHFIAGIHSPHDLLGLKNVKCLVLGYKNFGRGSGRQVDLGAWEYWIPEIIANRHVAFDNLALKQLNIKNRVSEYVWKKHYMGNDGQFTMYIDAVKRQYAASSVSPRHDMGGLTAIEMFESIRGYPKKKTRQGRSELSSDCPCQVCRE